MRIAPLAIALLVTCMPLASPAQDLDLATDEQILLKQVMADKRATYEEYLRLSEAESKAFWPIYGDYERRTKILDDRLLALVNDFAAKYQSLSDPDAREMLKEKLAIEKERAALKQVYTKKIVKALPPVKALRYAQLETRIEMMVRRDFYPLLPLAN